MSTVPLNQKTVMMEMMRRDGIMLNVKNWLESVLLCGSEGGAGSDVEKSEHKLTMRNVLSFSLSFASVKLQQLR